MLAHGTSLLSLAQLVAKSRHIVLATPVEQVSAWEDEAGLRRIVSYTTLDLHHSLDGRALPSVSSTVRTLGGRVGELGQRVMGEAELAVGTPALCFLTGAPGGHESVFRIAGMAQGYYSVAERAHELRLRASFEQLGHAHARATSAMARLHDQPLSACEQWIAEEVAS